MDFLEKIWIGILKLLGKWPKAEGLPKPIKVEDKKLDKYIKTETKYVQSEVKELIEDMEEIAVIPILSKGERLKRTFDLILGQILKQTKFESGMKELNLIHPEFSPYIAAYGSSGTAKAAELTEEKIQRLWNKIDHRYAEVYCYEALSAQWRKQYAFLIKEHGQKFLLDEKGVGFRAGLHELWRQTVWTDKDFADKWLIDNRIADAEIEEFLLHLAQDDCEFLPATDITKYRWKPFA